MAFDRSFLISVSILLIVWRSNFEIGCKFHWKGPHWWADHVFICNHVICSYMEMKSNGGQFSKDDDVLGQKQGLVSSCVERVSQGVGSWRWVLIVSASLPSNPLLAYIRWHTFISPWNENQWNEMPFCPLPQMCLYEIAIWHPWNESGPNSCTDVKFGLEYDNMIP